MNLASPLNFYLTASVFVALLSGCTTLPLKLNQHHSAHTLGKKAFRISYIYIDDSSGAHCVGIVNESSDHCEFINNGAFEIGYGVTDSLDIETGSQGLSFKYQWLGNNFYDVGDHEWSSTVRLGFHREKSSDKTITLAEPSQDTDTDIRLDLDSISLALAVGYNINSHVGVYSGYQLLKGDLTYQESTPVNNDTPQVQIKKRDITAHGPYGGVYVTALNKRLYFSYEYALTRAPETNKDENVSVSTNTFLISFLHQF